MRDESLPSVIRPPRPAIALGCWLLGWMGTTLAVQSLLSTSLTATTVMSAGLWHRCAEFLGASVQPTGEAPIGFLAVLVPVGLVTILVTAVGAVLMHRRKSIPFLDALPGVALSVGLWMLFPGLWEGLRIAVVLIGWEGAAAVLIASGGYWLAVAAAGVLTTILAGAFHADEASAVPQRIPKRVWLFLAAYVVVFTAMNWQLYRGLLTPHGDSVMYEEHLWNISHGKGFRSYLDRGLFLGEHIQVIHLGLLPLYWLWPSHLLLELCESLALASGAIPVFWIARRHSGSTSAAVLLAAAYLLYAPLQFLDIAIDLKTFRPTAFGVPVMLFALDQLERNRYRTMGLLFLLALCAKEDYAIILAPLGIWIACRHRHSQEADQEFARSSSTDRLISPRTVGIVVAVLSVAYLLLATRVVIPWFRGGEEVHYARYFRKFGTTLPEIVTTMATDPGKLVGELASPASMLYAVALLVPLGLLPILSPGRLAVAAPLFGILCLNEVAHDPRHHFHAPLVPIILWAAAAGTVHPPSRSERQSASPFRTRAAFACFCAAFCGLFSGLSPASIAFWDRDSDWHWGKLYVPGSRAEHFPQVLKQVPATARVFSTDFVHPRFTHHARSYDYSGYPRPSDRELTEPVPGIDYYLVIDTRHRYSKIRRPDEIPEYREHPGDWELLPDKTDGHFIILRRIANSQRQ